MQCEADDRDQGQARDTLQEGPRLLCLERCIVCALRDPDTIPPVKLLLDSSDFFYQTPQSDRFFSQISPFHICQHLQFRIILNGPPPSLNRSND
jgi:hypothetical protein